MRLVATYYLTFIGLGFVSAFLGPTLPFLADRIGVDLAALSNLAAIKSLGVMVGSFIAGRLYDRMRPHGLVQVYLAGTVLALLAIPATPHFGRLLALLFLVGFFSSSVDVGTNLLLVWTLHRRVAPFLTGMHFLAGVGSLLTPLVIVHFHRLTGSLAVPFLILGLTILACTLLYVRLPSPRPIHTATASDAPLARVPLAALMALLFLASTIESAMVIWLFSYVLETGMGPVQVAGWINASFFVAVSLSRLLAVFLLVRVAHRTVLYMALGLVLGACISVLLVPSSLTVLGLGVVLCGTGAAVLFPLSLALAPQYLPAEGRVTAWMYGGASFGYLVMPWLMGQLFAPVGPRVIWYTAGLAAVLNAACLAILQSTPRRAQDS